MFKRMTDTEKWKNNAWFRKLPKDYKLFWLYLNDDCDNAGVWEIDIELANSLMGTQIDRENTFKYFSHRIHEFESKNGNAKLWITGFCDFQYSGKGKSFNPAEPANRPQESYVNLLKYHGLLDLAIDISKGKHTLPIPYAKGKHTLKDKDKDKDKDRRKVLEKKFDLFYEQYPKKRQKSTAYTSFMRLAPSDKLFESILLDIAERSVSNDWLKEDGQFIPYPSSYLNQKRWTDEKFTSKSTVSRDNLSKTEHKGW